MCKRERRVTTIDPWGTVQSIGLISDDILLQETYWLPLSK